MTPRIVTASSRVSAVSARSVPGTSNEPPERNCFSNERTEAISSRANSGVSIPVCDQYREDRRARDERRSRAASPPELLTGFARPTRAIVRMPVVALASARTWGGARPIPWINVEQASHSGEV